MRTSDQSTRRKDPDIRPRPRTLERMLPHKKAMYGTFSEATTWDASHLGTVREEFQESDQINAWDIHPQSS